MGKEKVRTRLDGAGDLVTESRDVLGSLLGGGLAGVGGNYKAVSRLIETR
jgi:hypothetical protein